MRIALFVGALDTGGAQRQFAQLADALAARDREIVMIASRPQGQYWDWLAGRGGRVRLVALHPAPRAGGKADAASRLAATPRLLRRLLRESRPDVLYTALYLSNLLGWRAARGLGVPVVWGIRASQQELNWKRRAPYLLCRHLSSRVPLAIANSRAGLDDHRAHGFRFERALVIPNGIDTGAFFRDRAGGRRLREAWRVESDTRLVGLPGRLAPKKGHEVFLRAAASLRQRHADLRFVCIGDGPASLRHELDRLARDLGVADRLIWAGECRDMRAAYGALDLVCCPSAFGEGFPNVVAEAMACEVPCVASDVGDAAWVMGGTGTVVPPDDADALAAAIETSLRDEGIGAARAARERIVDRFSVAALVDGTEAALASVVAPAGSAE